MSVEPLTTTGALGAVSSPWWLPHLAPYSHIAAHILPLLGCAWLALRITAFLYKVIKNRQSTTD